MTNRWPPDTEHPLATAADRAALAEDRARLLARYWDDRVSRERNLSVIGWWLGQAERNDSNP